MTPVNQKIALGTVQFGLAYGISNTTGQILPDQAHQILDHAQKSGINMLDTAMAYGTSETVIGQYLKKHQSSFKVVSKLPASTPPGQIETNCETSLKYLHLTTLYGYLAHDANSIIENPKLWTAMQNLKSKNKVQKIGISLYFPIQIKTLLQNNIIPDIVQVPYSIVDQRFASLFPRLKKLGIEIHVRSVFLQGLLLMSLQDVPPFFAPLLPALKKLNALSQKTNIPISALALNFALANPDIDKVVIGVDNLSHLKHDLANLKYYPLVTTRYNQLQTLAITQKHMIIPTYWPKKT